MSEMTLLGMDSCRQPGNLGSQWTIFSPFSADANIAGLQHYDLDNDALPKATLQFSFESDEDDVVIIGSRFYINGLDNMNVLVTDDYVVGFHEGGIRHLAIKFTDSDGTVKVYRDAASTHIEIGASAAGAVPANTWFFMEVKVKIHDTLGTVQIRVDGSDVLNLTSLDTRFGGAAGLIDRITFGACETNTLKLRVCDIHILNEQGSAPFNDLIGPHTIESLRTDAAGNYTNWTPSAGANHDAVDDPTETVHDGDTTYVETTVVERDSYSFGNMVSAEDPIAVQAKATARFTGTQQDFNTFLRRSATDNDGPTETGTSGGYADRAITIWETDPIAVGAWTKTNLEATEFGIETT